MNEKRILEILEKINSARIAVYGDFCLDAYWLMDSDGSEVSVETGLQAEAVARHSYSPGGAGNIVANLAALKPAEIKVVGVLGNDIHGRELNSQMQEMGVDTSLLTLQKAKFDTYTYTKKYYGEKEDPRIDFGLKNERSKETDTEILKNLRFVLENFDALIFNQQVPGSITNESFIEKANKLFEEFNNKIVVLDSRHFNAQFRNVYRKANEIETAVLNKLDKEPGDFISMADAKKYGTNVFNQYQKPIFVTCGSRGIITIDSTGINETPGVQLLKRLDTVGAGDTTISALTLCLAAGIQASEAAKFANFAAAVTVQKLYTTGTASGEEIVALSENADFNYMPELASDIRLANYLPDSEIEICQEIIISRMGSPKHILFDHDGTISTLRQGWEQVMEPVMMKAILGKHFDSVDNSVLQEVRKQVLEFIDMSTGIQTIVQMEGLVNMVDEFNYVPKEEILDKHGYKEIYNEALMELVNKRLEKLTNGQLSVEDYTLKGAVEFLTRLKEKGVKLYLASGTDIEDVLNEAKILGYADLFEGEIHGSVGDINKYSKKMVIDKIITDNNLNGEELVVFGDGPVEIKECVRFDGIAIGVASDEIRRHDLNPEKRSR
ncbi:MAG: PfkB family carbohydrate kinase, partial [Bacteroidales bacterium]|nr:PfkB family carbohydrate kinase [Bacteroidales bacterium]